MNYQAIIQALLYAAGDDGTTIQILASTLALDAAAVRQWLEKLTNALQQDQTSGLEVLHFGETYKLATKRVYAQYLTQFMSGNIGQHLSQAALEVLAIVAYEQPITRLEIDELRGVNSSGALQTLVARQMLQEQGRKDVPGRPILYGTSDYFLDYFGLQSLDNLPPIDQHTPSDSGNEDMNLFYNEFDAAMNQNSAKTTAQAQSDVQEKDGLND
ncbi:SMC-Scp complex subunit ScpB [Agrilactobacillus fermenti]|uniref:SMC-Scp complex subunit ScpB n=1 Tax=Agrilactobacillus fermenti TaxID=2586909 RepID=UPI001E35DC11|nr:SMC-Scp complex subunit ScpB [Agrilactobacillus fermenti]MCD2255220.1 SMC-Scp complex subunit ScpB [Agrilactobacillus fermenti]